MSGSKLIFELKYRRVNEGYSIYMKGKTVKTQIGLLAETPETQSLLGGGTWPQLMCCALVAVWVPEVRRGRVGVLEQGGSSDDDQDKWTTRRKQTRGIGDERNSSQIGRRMLNTMRRVSKLTGVSLSWHGCVSVDIQTEVQEGKRRVFTLKGKPRKRKRNKISGQCSRATRVPSGGNTASEEPKIRRSERG